MLLRLEPYAIGVIFFIASCMLIAELFMKSPAETRCQHLGGIYQEEDGTCFFEPDNYLQQGVNTI